MYYQNDNRWKNDIMTHPPYLNGSKQQKPDTLGTVGCYVTALTNCYNNLNESDLTPADVNENLKRAKAYKYMVYGKECPINQESFLMEMMFEKLYSVKISDPISVKNYIPGKQFICRWNYSKTIGHYSNVTGSNGDNFIVFNVFNNRFEIVPKNNIDFLREVTV